MVECSDCGVCATPRSDTLVDGDASVVEAMWSRCGLARQRQSRLAPWFSPSPLLTFTVRVTNGNVKVGFTLTPASQPRVYLFHSVRDVQSVPTRVKKGEHPDALIAPEPTDSSQRQFMDKRLFVHLQGGRKVSGTLRGYDLFLNLVLDDAQEETTPAQRHPIGTVVGATAFCLIFCPELNVLAGYPG